MRRHLLVLIALIVVENVVQTPPAGKPFIEVLTKESPKNLSEGK